MKKLNLSPEQAKRRLWLSMAIFVGFIVFLLVGYNVIIHQPEEDGALSPFQRVLEFNEKVTASINKDHVLSPEYPVSRAANPARANGNVGIDSVIDASSYRFIIENPKNENDSMLLGLADLKTLPYKDLVFNFKCIEGWCQIQHWGGVRFCDVVKKYHLASKTGQPVVTGMEPWCYKYLGLETPDGEYYVGIDMKSAMHPQTILAWNMNGRPLPQNQGAPLRLIIPVKYGVKHLKQIGRVFFSDEKPADYWAERGYDYDSGL